MTCKHNNVSIFNNGSLHTWQCADCGGKAQKPYIHSPPFDVWPQESDIHYAEPKVFQFQPIRKTAYMVTPFNETIQEIAEKAVEKIIADYKGHYDFPWQGESHMRDCLATELPSFILSAFDEFAKQKTSAEMTACGVAAWHEYGTFDAVFRAMLAQAVKEMKDWTPNTTQK